jgi:hypothetical protein
MSNNKANSVIHFSRKSHELFEMYSEGKIDRINLNIRMTKLTQECEAMYKTEMQQVYHNASNFAIYKGGTEMEISEQQSPVEWLIEQFYNNEGMMTTKKLNKAKEMEMEQNKITENTSDGYHTFKELYEIRKAYNVALFNEWGKFDIPSYNVHKSWKHHDGEFCFGGGWFIVVAIMPTGQISNHYKAEDWDLFKIPEVEKALFPFDGHTTEDVIYRLINFLGLK